MRLTYHVRENLHIPRETYNADGIGVIVLHGARYGGSWLVKALAATNEAPAVRGKILTAESYNPDDALETGEAWLAVSGATIAHPQRLNDSLRPAEKPFYTLGQYVLVNELYVPQAE